MLNDNYITSTLKYGVRKSGKKINSCTSLKVNAWYTSTYKIGTFSCVCEIIYEAADRITGSVRALIYLLSSPNIEMGPFRDSVSPK